MFQIVKQDRLWLALRRRGLHEQFIGLFQGGFAKSTFLVEDEYGSLQTKQQLAGMMLLSC
jgi:hypothetical protein